MQIKKCLALVLALMLTVSLFSVSMIPSVNAVAGDVTRFEGETTSYVVSDGATAAKGTFSPGGNSISGDGYLQVSGGGVGEYVTYTVSTMNAGSYSMSWQYRSHDGNPGVVQVSVNGTNIGDPISTYATKKNAMLLVTVGDVELNEGDNTITFTLTGTTSGDRITVDYFEFTEKDSRSVVGITNPDTLNLTYGDPYLLPQSVSLQMSDNTTEEVEVSWDISEFTPAIVGTYVLTGSLPATVSNPDKLAPSLTVVIGEKPENITYLSDLTPTSESFSWAGKWVDAAVEYKAYTLQMNGVATYQVKGVSANATAKIAYAVPVDAVTFESYVGITGAASGQCTFAVYLDGEDVTPANVSGVVFTRDSEAEKISLNVQGKSSLEIRILQSGDSVNGANGTYSDAKFIMRNDPKADYTAVNAAIEAAEKIDRTQYTVASCKAVDAAVAAVVTGKYATEQAEVDAMAAAIENAISQLAPKSAYTLSDVWTFKNEDKTLYDLESEKQITMYTTTGELWDSPRVYTNMLLTDAGEGDFSVTTKLSFAPDTDYQSAGLIVYASDEEIFSVQRRYHSGHGNNCVCGVDVQAGSPSENAVADTAVGSDIYLKIVRTGTSFEASWSTDNSTWETVWTKEHEGLSGAVQVGLFTGKGGNKAETAEIPATFRDFTLNDTVVAFAASIYADYTAVDAALDKAAALTEGDYTEASWAKLQTAVNAVVRDLTASEQATVDGYAAAIEEAILALVPASAEMELTIGAGMVTAAAEGKYDITWNARILLPDDKLAEDINAAGVKFKNYGVYYSTGKDVLDDYKNASADQIRKIVFAQGEDVDVYTAYGFRLKNVTENRVRAAMFYIEYELNGQSYILLSTVDEVLAVIAA
ncbi:MAG: NPCBM/NEW2 domain-containing protein [Candidatus Howiella sp.]|jgi:regulation of enolase protein 1 (concanavalin A-like superfamily)